MPSTGGSRVELPKPSLLQEVIDHASMHNWVPAYRALILSIIAEHVRQNLGASKTLPGAKTKKLLTGSGMRGPIGGDLLIALNPIPDVGEVALSDGIVEAVLD